MAEVLDADATRELLDEGESFTIDEDALERAALLEDAAGSVIPVAVRVRSTNGGSYDSDGPARAAYFGPGVLLTTADNRTLLFPWANVECLEFLADVNAEAPENE